MCHVRTDAPYDRPIAREDVDMVKKHYSDVDAQIIEDLYAAITDYHTPKPALLVGLVELFSRGQKKDNGMYDWPFLPFSALDLDTWHRVKTPEIEVFHETFASFALAQRNIGLVNDIFKKNGLTFATLCHCGACAPMMSVNIFETQSYKEINAVRSEMEAVGAEVIMTDSFEDPEWVNKNIDMGSTEINSYKRMWNVLRDLSGMGLKSFHASTLKGMELLRSLTVEK